MLHACRFKDDQVFEEIIETQIKAVSLIDGEWYVRLDGDLAGKVVGAVYDASAGETELVPIALSVSMLTQQQLFSGVSASCSIGDSQVRAAGN